MLNAVLLIYLCFNGDLYRAEIRPVDYQNEKKPATLIKGLTDIKTNGDDLFILIRQEPGVLQIKPDGSFVRKIGKAGNGPGELGEHDSAALAVRNQSVWIKGINGFLNYYEKGEYVTGFKPKETQFKKIRASYQFAFNNDVIVYQVFPGSSGKLANVYNYGGDVVKMVGDILPIDDKYLRVNPALNNTMWHADDTYFYCMFFYRPFIRVFSQDTLKLEREITLHGPEVDMFEEKYLEAEKETRFRYPPPHVLLCDSTFYKIELKTGELKNRAYFWGKRETILIDTPKVSFAKFTITKANQLFLVAEVMGLGHDGLWTAIVPFIE